MEVDTVRATAVEEAVAEDFVPDDGYMENLQDQDDVDIGLSEGYVDDGLRFW